MPACLQIRISINFCGNLQVPQSRTRARALVRALNARTRALATLARQLSRRSHLSFRVPSPPEARIQTLARRNACSHTRGGRSHRLLPPPDAALLAASEHVRRRRGAAPILPLWRPLRCRARRRRNLTREDDGPGSSRRPSQTRAHKWFCIGLRIGRQCYWCPGVCMHQLRHAVVKPMPITTACSYSGSAV